LVGLFKNGRTWIREKRLAALTLIAVALATSGGISTLIALELTTQIRAWSRISIFIAFFALVAMALLMTVAWRWAGKRGWSVPAVAALAGLLVLVIVEQTSSAFVPQYVNVRHTYLGDKAFVESVEASLPSGAAIYMLPYRQYPEAGPREGAFDYDNLKPYLLSDALRFSYGGMKGREAGWQTYVYGRPPADALPLVYLAGFSAVWVDRWAYSDGGTAAEQAIRSLTQTEPVVSANGRFSVFDIRAWGERLTANLDDSSRADLEGRFLAPIWLRWRDGAQRANIGDDGRITRPVERSAELGLVNAGQERPITVSFQIESLVGSRPVSIEWPDGFTESVTADPVAPIARTVVLPAGESRVRIALDGPVGQDGASARIHDLWAIDPELLAIEASLAPP
jgi:phosphoglycerol transferase